MERQLNSATCPPIFMQFTGQNNGGTASSAFLYWPENAIDWPENAIDWPEPA